MCPVLLYYLNFIIHLIFIIASFISSLTYILFLFAGLKYQHWVEILNAFPGLDLINLNSSFTDKNVTIGGSLVLKSNFVSLTCFHGSNFRAQTWALFSINEPTISFVSEVFCVEKSCQVERAFSKQEISVKLGHEDARHEKSKQLGTRRLF